MVAAADAGLDELSEQLVTRSFEAAGINAVINHPVVFPLVSVPGIDRIDVSAIVADPRNVLLMADGGGVLFIADIEPGIYEVHTNFLPEKRGVNAIRSSLAAYRWMFTHTDCMTLQTKVPAFNKPAEQFCRVVGAIRDFDRKAVWPAKDGPVDLSFWSMRYDDWVRQTPELKKSGQRFHVRLIVEKLRHGYAEPPHADEDCHDLHVGACVEMIYGGQPEKAVILYNRWARFAGYQPIALISRAPIVIDIGEALLQITGDTFKVVLCR